MRFPLLAALIVGLALAACTRPAAEEAPEAKAKLAPGVDVELTEQGLIAARLKIEPVRVAPRLGALVAQGTIALSPKRVAKVGSLVDGRIGAMRVQEGDRVKAGEVLATIDSIEVGRARADHAQAQARLRFAERELARNKQLVADGVASDRVVTQSQTDRDVANIEAKAAGERLRAVGVSPGGGDQAGNGVALVSPIAGVVLTAKARVGEAVASSDTLFMVGDLSELTLMVEVYERDLARVRVGDPVRVTSVAVPGRVFEGRVDHVMETLDPMRRAADVRVVLPNVDGVLRPGMSATSRIAVGEAASASAASASAPAGSTAPAASSAAAASAVVASAGQAVLVPRGALQFIDGLAHVFVEKGERKYELRAVDPGAAYEGDVEIVRGLVGGERVVTEGAFILKSQVLREQMGSND